MTPAHSRIWFQSRPPADRLGNAPHVYGRLLGPDETPRRSWLAKLMGRGA